MFHYLDCQTSEWGNGLAQTHAVKHGQGNGLAWTRQWASGDTCGQAWTRQWASIGKPMG
jgi:hypothetical protein